MAPELVVKSTALWLGKLLVEETKYLGAVRDEVEVLQTELKALAAFLIEAVKARYQDNIVQNAVSEARDVAYDCEDVIEEYILKMARHGYEDYDGCQLGTVLRWACILPNAVALHEIRSNIDKLNRRISALKATMEGYGVPSRINIREETDPAEHPSNELRRMHPHNREDYVVVGLQNDLDNLTKVLLDPNYSEKRVIAIYGMGGVGKSTLAIELYHHSQIRTHFRAFAWVVVSRQFQTDRILEKLIYQLVPENDESRRRLVEHKLRAGQAHEVLYKLMKETKCLVVVDDIWTSTDWAKLKDAFPKDSTESKILLTSRNQETLSGLDQDMVYRHLMQGLDEKWSWKLFEKTTFPSSICTDPEKKKLGLEMLRHCNGVPLAIVVLGKALKIKPSVEDWKQMHDNICAQIQKSCTANKPYRKVYDVLQVSYDELSSHLKHCFLHLANFPEDYQIPTDRLFHLWIGEGLVLKEDPNELEEDVAERYLNELVSRSMVQVGEWAKGPKGRIETCHLHDLTRDICIDIAKKEGFLQIINCERPMQLMASLPERDKRLRRLAIHVTKDQELAESLTPSTTNVSRAPKLRSLLFFPLSGNRHWENREQFVKTVCKEFPLLRVLDCQYFLGECKFPREVGSLIHLRYLSLAGTGVVELPSSIEQLFCLQTLDLQVKGPRISMPNILWKMKQLRHLYLPESFALCGSAPLTVVNMYSIKGGGRLRLKGLQNLQTITNIDLDGVDIQGLSEYSSMRRLENAVCVSNRMVLYPFLRSLSMQSFSLSIDAKILDEEPMILSGCKCMNRLHILAAPDACLRRPICLESFPKSLVYLRIRNLKLDADPLPILEKLPNLASLTLSSCYSGKKMGCSAGGFLELEYLVFSGLRSFSDWEVEEGALPKLKILKLINCNVKKLPDTLPSSVNVDIRS